MDEVYKFLEELNLKNKCVVVALSGGPDSMLLIDILLTLKDKLNLKIVAAHVHHNLRAESDEEAIRVEEYCNKNNITFEFHKIENYPNDKFSEEAARKIRYDFFDKIVRKHSADILFTAHHGDDLIETVLMKISRGSNLKGYAGFERISYDRGYKIARPLIFLTKDEILKKLDSRGIWYAVDSSNSDLKYTRNRYRNKILPELKKENPNVHYKFIEYNEKIILAHSFLEKVTDKIYDNIVFKNEINIDEFNKQDIIIKIYLLERFFKNIYEQNITYINNKHIDIIINRISKRKNMEFDLPLNKKAVIEYNNFRVINKNKITNYNLEFTDYVKLPNGKVIENDISTTLTTNYVIHLNSKDIKLPFYVRNRKPGDVMRVKNMLGTKKISDIFIDSKIPKEQRGEYPIVTDSTGEIIWIPGIKKSHLDRKKQEKYDIILKYN